MKYFKRLKVYKASNVLFDPEKIEAYSYNWWSFVKNIEGKVIFNNYNYSNSTCKHQSKVRSLLCKLNIKVDAVIECPKGLQNLESGIVYYKRKIKKLKEDICKPRTHKKTNEKRLIDIERYNEKIEEILNLIQCPQTRIKYSQLNDVLEAV
jgi:hypothetical protein